MKHILFNMASRTRGAKFNRVVNQIYEYCTEPFTILAKVDDDDPNLSSYDLSRVTHVGGTCTSKIDAINKGIPKEGWDILCDVSDDFVFTRAGFDSIIRAHCGPNDVLHFPEPFAKGRIIIMAVMGNEYYNKYGFVFNPAYKSLFCDDELTAVAKKVGAYKFINEDIFRHEHPAAGYGKPDRQTMITEAFWHQDKRTFEKRKEKGFPV